MTSHKPRIIAFEGVDGAGKSTVIHRVAEHLRARGEPVYLPRSGKEHDSRPTRMIRRLTRDQRNVDLVPQAEFALYCAREAQVLEELVRPALARGESVLLDRSLLTPVVLGSFGRGLDRVGCEAAAQVAANGLDPDLTLVFDVHPKTSRIRKRIGKVRDQPERDSGRKGLAGSSLKERVRDGYGVVARERGYPLFHVERVTPDQLADRVIEVLEGGPLVETPDDSRPVWMRDDLDLAAAIDELPVSVSLYLTRGLIMARELRARLLEREPALVAWGLDREDPLRERAARVHIRFALSGLQRSPFRGPQDLRERFADEAPMIVLRALKETGGAAADALRLRLVEREPGSVVESLAGREDPWAVELRARLWKQADPYQRATSLAGCSGPEGARLRDALFEKQPIRGLSSLSGVAPAIADPWLRRYASLAPKPVLGAIHGRMDAYAHELRDALFETGREVIDTIRGLDDEASWALRERGLARWPSTVAWSLAGLPEDARFAAMLARCKEAGAGDMHLARRLVGLEERARWPEWALGGDDDLGDDGD